MLAQEALHPLSQCPGSPGQALKHCLGACRGPHQHCQRSHQTMIPLATSECISRPQALSLAPLEHLSCLPLVNNVLLFTWETISVNPHCPSNHLVILLLFAVVLWIEHKTSGTYYLYITEQGDIQIVSYLYRTLDTDQSEASLVAT